MEVVKQDLPSTQTATQVITEGQDRAKQLMGIVSQKGWSTNIQGKNFLQVEAWQTLGRFYGYTAKTKSTEYVEMGNVKGFNAVVEILDSKGVVVGGADAGCYSDEQKWNTESHTNKFGKTVDGSPLYSLKSMAQTRATGKAFRQMLSWVAVMAGYQPTPAEEMDGINVETPRTYEKPVQTTQTQDLEATQPQINRLNDDIKYLVSWGKLDRNTFLRKHNAPTAEPLMISNLGRKQASRMIDELIPLTHAQMRETEASRNNTVVNKYQHQTELTEQEINEAFDGEIVREESN